MDSLLPTLRQEIPLEAAFEKFVTKELGPDVVIIDAAGGDAVQSISESGDSLEIAKSADMPAQSAGATSNDNETKPVKENQPSCANENDTAVDEVRNNIISEIIYHANFNQYLEWANLSMAHFKQTSVDLDVEIGRWLWFLTVRAIAPSGATKTYVDMIESRMTELSQNPRTHPCWDYFLLTFRNENKRYPFTLIYKIVDDFKVFQEWSVQNTAEENEVRRKVKKALLHCLWPSYILHIEGLGAEASDFESVDAIMQTDGAETMKDWCIFLTDVPWVKQD